MKSRVQWTQVLLLALSSIPAATTSSCMTYSNMLTLFGPQILHTWTGEIIPALKNYENELWWYIKHPRCVCPRAALIRVIISKASAKNSCISSTQAWWFLKAVLLKTWSLDQQHQCDVPWNLLEVQVLRLHLRPSEANTVGFQQLLYTSI